MNITVNINIPALTDLAKAIEVLASSLGGKAIELPIKRETPEAKATKTEVKESKAEETKPKIEELAEEAGVEISDTDMADIPTVVDLRAKAQEKGKTAEGKKAIKALLDKYDSKSISNVPEEVRAAFMADLEAL
ncbi:hypothetical protein KQI88_15825 [Alkaliphilus sp. MSJ-5]|uniref:rRNA biogenesis protein rrp5 n=1 Tax=Alkaliphilus flagellatus TaxID=2841507 RepID=A0ABS6G5X6_9FIRM|nr:hypothetical protein [Alkaliphilus flagellatus]MBU5677887.1 hypothetical protein [Alkaliphilus flagellatus]